MFSHSELTPRQTQILEYIKTHIRKIGYPPSVRDICAACGLQSTSTVHGYLKRLENAGYIRRDASIPRGIELLDRDQDGMANADMVPVPVMGQTAAGEPIWTNEGASEYLPTPKSWVNGEDAMWIDVHGDSMVNVGIMDGDRVLIRRQDSADNGDIVIALLDDGTTATCKRFYKEKGHYRLQPENDMMQPIIVDDVKIAGKVTALYRLMK